MDGQVSEKTSQQIVEEKARQAADRAKAGGQQAQKAAFETWQGAKTAAEKMMLIGALIAIIAFFLPWITINLGGTSLNLSGWSLASNGQKSGWLLPLTMAAVLFLSWLNLNGAAPKRILNARWIIAIGAAWSWSMITMIMNALFGSGIGPGSVAFGAYFAALGSLLVLIGGIRQVQDNLDL